MTRYNLLCFFVYLEVYNSTGTNTEVGKDISITTETVIGKEPVICRECEE